jgi:hypothetical protein
LISYQVRRVVAARRAAAKATVVRDTGSPGDPTNYKRAMWRVRRLWEEGKTEFLPHAQLRMLQRGIEVGDVRHIVKHGRIVEHSRPRERWRYRIEGTSVDGHPLDVVVEVNGHLVIVTVIAKVRIR